MYMKRGSLHGPQYKRYPLYVKRVSVRIASLHDASSTRALSLCKGLPIWDLLNKRASVQCTVRLIYQGPSISAEGLCMELFYRGHCLCRAHLHGFSLQGTSFL